MRFDYRFIRGTQSATERGNDMKALITEIVQAIVVQPERVMVVEIDGDHTSVLELRVAKSDMGKVIGK
jgi:predicted RNA-binding protein YlqC (UPF0109 family)